MEKNRIKHTSRQKIQKQKKKRQIKKTKRSQDRCRRLDRKNKDYETGLIEDLTWTEQLDEAIVRLNEQEESFAEMILDDSDSDDDEYYHYPDTADMEREFAESHRAQIILYNAERARLMQISICLMCIKRFRTSDLSKINIDCVRIIIKMILGSIIMPLLREIPKTVRYTSIHTDTYYFYATVKDDQRLRDIAFLLLVARRYSMSKLSILPEKTVKMIAKALLCYPIRKPIPKLSWLFDSINRKQHKPKLYRPIEYRKSDWFNKQFKL